VGRGWRERKGGPYNSSASGNGRSTAATKMSDSYKQIAKRAPHGHPASPPPPQHLNSRAMVQRAIIAPLLIHGGGGLAPLAQQPERPSPLYPFGESARGQPYRHRPGWWGARTRSGACEETNDERGGAVASVSDATETRQTAPVCRVGRGGG